MPLESRQASMYSRAFSMVELLAVVAIMGLLSVLGIAAVGGLQREGMVNQAVSGISLTLGQARAYAMAHDTYVWVGFAPNTTSQQLIVGVVAAATGNVSDINSTDTCLPISKLQTYNHISLKTINGLTGMSTSGDDISASQVGSFQQTGGGTTVTFTDVLQYSPEGEATINKSPGTSHWIQIGLQPVIGGNNSNPDVAVFQVAALTGQVQIFRP